MIQLKILIKTKDDPKYDAKDDIEGDLDTVVIIENGMQSGKTSMLFSIKLPDGSSVFAQTSVALFNSMVATLKGAEMRFEDNKSKNN